jgi:hypothetical protein
MLAPGGLRGGVYHCSTDLGEMRYFSVQSANSPFVKVSMIIPSAAVPWHDSGTLLGALFELKRRGKYGLWGDISPVWTGGFLASI